jgi:hypothetical protein
MYRSQTIVMFVVWFVSASVSRAGQAASPAHRADANPLHATFQTPPPEARPWVYWMVMDGNLTREGITADLEAMKRAGIGGAIFMETDQGIARGPMRFMSPPWQELIKHAFQEADRLGLEVALSTGPGWCGTGGPWVKPEQSMQHLVGSETRVKGPAHFDARLSQPSPRTPFFGEGTLTPELHKVWKEFYRDVCVLAFPTPAGGYRIPDVDEKALYFRPPYSSQAGTKPYLSPDHTVLPQDQCIAADRVLDLTGKMTADGRLAWDVPAGEWTVIRFGRTVTGQTTRPAPAPGLGLECDKFSRAALDEHFSAYMGTLLKATGEPPHRGRGLTTLHFDSWEMSSQNWSEKFREEFRTRRGYDLLPFLPAMLGRVVSSVGVSERFLWDLRRTAQDLVVENHGIYLKELAHRHGLGLSIEPYDLNPAGDLELGTAGDVPMGEFWSRGFNTTYSILEAVSVSHTEGRPVVGAESFTSGGDAWQFYPAVLKAQGDWALCAGVNRFVFHRYAHQPWLNRFPGMTFGGYGVHWDRTETWWDLACGYHQYLARCQAMLRRGLPVADILYLDLEGAPDAFSPPASAMLGGLPDRRGHGFDGCAPSTLLARASVKDSRIAFPNGMSYGVLVLPRSETMTPALLGKIQQLVRAGATVIGSPPQRSPSLENYPTCDQEVRQRAAEVWSDHRVVLDTEAGSHKNVLQTARWIWHNEGNPAASAPVGQRYFRREVEVPAEIATATCTMTADNSFELFVNDTRAGTGDNFHQQYTFDVTRRLHRGKNVLKVTATNDGPARNPAGLIGSLAIALRDGKKLMVVTDHQWNSSLEREGRGSPALELGKWSMGPWSLSEPVPQLYPDYETAARILAKRKSAPDFQSDADLRYIHRHTDHAEIYFVGNRTAERAKANCRFRVGHRVPELWDPLTGQRRALPEFFEENGQTTVPLQFSPEETCFVVFRDRAGAESPAAGKSQGPTRFSTNFPLQKPMAEITGPWDVSFDPKWGGPEHVIFDRLEDWTRRSETSIRYYSGKAVYHKTFDAPTSIGPVRRHFLELGRVAVMARVQLNGQDLGVAWCAPWRVPVPAGILKPTGNQLEITVANLWANRLIRDSGLPQAQRLTWSTWNPYHPTDALLPSGLLGPVRLMAEEE